MRRISLIAASFVLAALSVSSAFAQAPAAGSTGFKMAVINTQAFDDTKGGIGRYSAALNSLDTEFKPISNEIQTMVTKGQALAKEIEAARNNTTVPVNQSTLQAKADEIQKLEREVKFKQEDAQARLQRRQQIVLGPIQQEIGKALQEYAKKNGYALILDAAKLDGAGLILAYDETKVDVTKDFITFFNARPATVASAAVPK
ncbi:MAG: OmpH family outer membrane protein [Acidobacteria bacterium]|nr:OmpH family outer membrane protein [Acidobacteriota bacterium]MCA1608012.1 OmpH family outer membrane protein [Acidobacteriota bacterium]